MPAPTRRPAVPAGRPSAPPRATAPASRPAAGRPTGRTMGSAPDRGIVEIDLRGVKSGGARIPPGEYLMRLSDFQTKRSQAGNSMYVWEFQVQEGTYRGKTSLLFTALTEGAMWKIKETLVALEMIEEDYDGILTFNPDDAIGRYCVGIVELQEYNGETRPALKGVIRYLGDAEGDEDDEGDEEE